MSNRLSTTKALVLALGIYAYGCGGEGDEDVLPGQGTGQPTGSNTGTVTPPASDAGQVTTTPPTGTGNTGTGNTGTGNTGTGNTGTGNTGTGKTDGGNTGTGNTGTGKTDGGNTGTGNLDGGTTSQGDGSVSPPNDGGTTEGGSTNPPVTGGGKCLEGITDYEKAGPFKYAAKTAGKIKYWVPQVPAGCKVPVVHLANGTTAVCSNYQQVLNRLASHGFLAACYEDPNTGAGEQGLQALETAFTMFPDLVDNRIGSTGHSQGGQAAFVVLQLAEAKWGDKMTYAGLAMQPASGFGDQPKERWQTVYGKIKSPMFMFSGTADILVSESWVSQGFSALADTIEAYWWSAVGATHIPTPEEHTNQVAISWFRWKLLGDVKACEHFKKLPDGSQWDKRKSQNEKPCQ